MQLFVLMLLKNIGFTFPKLRIYCKKSYFYEGYIDLRHRKSAITIFFWNRSPSQFCIFGVFHENLNYLFGMYFVRRIIFWQIFFRSNKTSLRQIDFRDIEKRGPEKVFCTARDIWIIVLLFQEIPKITKLLPSQKFWKWSFTRVRSTSFLRG